MRRRLCIGVHHLGPDWAMVLDHIGVNFEEIDYSENLPASYSLIILNGFISNEEKRELITYLDEGCALLEVGEHHIFHDKANIQYRSADTLINQSDMPAFAHIPMVDLHDTVMVHKRSTLFEGMIHLSAMEKGYLGFIGANIPALMQDLRYTRKRFYTNAGAFPDEIVSQVSKHDLLELLEIIMKELHFKQSLPFIQKWTSPAQEPVFCFRIDSDFGDRYSIDQLYELMAHHQIPATWFLHIKAHLKWLDRFKDFKGQELALHGFSHGTSNLTRKLRQNISKGLEELSNAGIQVSGYAAPYGITNEAHISVFSDFPALNYCSDFSFGYDGHPLNTSLYGMPLQIPIHPICTGSLNRKGYETDQMLAYFSEVFAQKKLRHQPVLFYHHPLQVGLEMWGLFFKKVLDDTYHKMTFDDYAKFWLKRQDCSFECYVQEDALEWDEITDPDQYFQCSYDHRHSDLFTQSMIKAGNAHTISFSSSNAYIPTEEQVKQLRNKDWTHFKTSLLDWKNRIRL